MIPRTGRTIQGPARGLAGLLLWGLLVPGLLHSAELVREVRFSGNRGLTTRALLARIQTRPGREYSAPAWKEDLAALRVLYREEGYWEADFKDSLRTSGEEVRLVVRVEEGPRVVVGKISPSGCRALPENAFLTLMDLRPGAPFRQETFEADLDRILNRYEDLGHPLAVIAPEDFERRAGKLYFNLRVWEGPQVAIDSVQVRGNEETSASVVAREFRLRPGEIYRGTKAREGWRRLVATGFFTEVGEPAVVPFANQDSFRLVWHGVLAVSVREGRPNRAEGVLGYVPKEGGKGYASGCLTFALRNLLGSGRALGLRWERLRPANSLLFLSYEEPYAFTLPLSLGGEVTHEVRDSSYVRTSGAVFARIPLSATTSLSLGFGRERVVPGTAGKSFYGRSDKSLSTFGLAYARLDDALNPRYGLALSGSGEYGIKTLPGQPGNVKVTRASGDGAFHIPLGRGGEGRGFSLALLAHGRITASSEKFVPAYEQFYLGGANTLRGYAEEQFLGSRIAWTNLELRRLISRNSRLAAFYDLGYYREKRLNPFLPDSSEIVKGIKSGYGIGLRTGNDTALLKLDYALGQGDRFEQGKIHLGLESRF